MFDIEYPPISCRCITYGRINTLEEAIYSFLNQNYPGKKELIIVNDYPLQKLKLNHPEIHIYNTDSVFPTIGDKENFTIKKCKYDIIALWDDDDIALSNHLTNISRYFTEETALLHWQRGILFNRPKIEAITSLGNAGMVYRKSIWEQIGHYPLENAGYDTTFVNKILSKFPNNITKASPPDNEVSWIYYWGHRSYHMSGLGADDETRPNVIQRHTEYIENERIKGNIPTGDISLNPNWEVNYTQLLKEYISN
jgi:hypothetical protein